MLALSAERPPGNITLSLAAAMGPAMMRINSAPNCLDTPRKPSRPENVQIRPGLGQHIDELDHHNADSQHAAHYCGGVIVQLAGQVGASFQRHSQQEQRPCPTQRARPGCHSSGQSSRLLPQVRQKHRLSHQQAGRRYKPASTATR